MVGPEGLRRLREAHVAVIGLGAVGSYATEALARAGVGRLRLVDFDEIRASNINRQLYALESTVGRPKVEVAAERVRDINPACNGEALRLFVHQETLDEALVGPPDLTLDCIDSLAPKLELLSALVERGLPALTCMGAALRTEPWRVRVGLLSEVTVCPLARRRKKGLRKRGLSTDIPCVHSDEPVDRAMVREPEESGEEGPRVRGRARRTLGSLPTLTGIFGLTMANEALRMILGDQWPRQG